MAAASSLTRDTSGPPGSLGSCSCRVNGSEHSSKVDAIDLKRVLAECLGDVAAKRRSKLSASQSVVRSPKWVYPLHKAACEGFSGFNVLHSMRFSGHKATYYVVPMAAKQDLPNISPSKDPMS